MNNQIEFNNLKYNDRDLGWGYLFAVLIPLCFQLVVSVILSIVSVKQGITPTDILNIDYVAAIYYALNGITMLALFVVFNKVRKKKTFVAAKIDFKFGWINLLICIVLAFVVLFGFNNFVNLLTHLMSLAGYNPDASMPLPLNTVGWLFVNLLVLALIPAICEELIYRGIIMNGLRRFGTPVAAFASGAIFALAHGSAIQTVYQFILGVVLAYVVIKTGSIIASMVVHFLNNAIVIVVNFITNITANDAVEAVVENASWSAFDIIIAICMAIASTGVILLLLSFLKPKKKEILYEKSKDKFDQTAKVLLIVSILISFIIWCIGTFV